jgi:integrase
MAGNITKIRDGSYRLRYKDNSKNVTASSDREASKLLAAFVTEIDSGDFTKNSKVTFKELVKKYMEEYVEGKLAKKTEFRYRQLLESRLLPYFGSKRLDKIKPLDIIEFYNSLRGKHKYTTKDKDGKPVKKESSGLSEQSIKHHHRLLHAIYEKAIRWQIYKGVNPVDCVDAPKVEVKEVKVLDEEQAREVMEALDNEELKYKVAIMLELHTGVRVGELAGLEWQDIDFNKNVINIRRSSQSLPGEGTFTKTTKTEKSRAVSMGEDMADLLKEYRADQREKGFLCTKGNRLFVRYDGTPVYTYTLSQWFPKFLKKNNMEHINFHALRHTNASLLIGQGVDIQTVAGRLGHSDSATTQRIYAHFLKSRDKDAAEKINNFLGKKGESVQNLSKTNNVKK